MYTSFNKQIAMAYNRNVTRVEIQVAPTANKDTVIDIVQKKMEVWRGGACPDWTREVIAPFSVIGIPQSRMKEAEHEKAFHPMGELHYLDWQLDWLRKT